MKVASTTRSLHTVIPFVIAVASGMIVPHHNSATRRTTPRTVDIAQATKQWTVSDVEMRDPRLHIDHLAVENLNRAPEPGALQEMLNRVASFIDAGRDVERKFHMDFGITESFKKMGLRRFVWVN